MEIKRGGTKFLDQMRFKNKIKTRETSPVTTNTANNDHERPNQAGVAALVNGRSSRLRVSIKDTTMTDPNRQPIPIQRVRDGERGHGRALGLRRQRFQPGRHLDRGRRHGLVDCRTVLDGG